MPIEINKDLPTPPPATGRPRIYPFPTMEVGDSFAVPLTGIIRKSEDVATDRLRCAAVFYARKHGCKFTVRSDRENGVVRCWRVS